MLTSFRMPLRATVVAAIILISAISLAFSLLMETDTPHEDALGAVASRGHIADAERVLESALLPFEITVINEGNPLGLAGDSGGLHRVGDDILAVDRAGRMLLLRTNGNIQPLNVEVSTNRRAAFSGIDYDEHTLNRLRVFSRILDAIVIDENDGGYRLVVSHHYWRPDSSPLGFCKTTRVSQFIIPNGENFHVGAFQIAADDWQVIFESQPCLTYEMDEAGVVSNMSPVRSNRTGGQLALTDTDILLSLGDMQMDGLGESIDAAQSPDHDYGKFIAIDRVTGESRHFAIGTRNAQGLTVRRDGTIFATEHGPEGGDELNIVREGANYGWAEVTYGTDYGTYRWPANERQGRHEGFEPPLFSWVPSIATSDLIVVDETLPEWEGDLVVASLKARSLYRVRLEDDRVTLVEPIRIGERVRAIEQFADGDLLLLLSQEFWRLSPLEAPVMRISTFTDSLSEDEILLGVEDILLECSRCHALFAQEHQYAPSLQGILGRDVAAVSFEYSDALASLGGSWTEERLFDYIQDPQAFAPGTTMPSYAYGTDEQIRAVVEALRILE